MQLSAAVHLVKCLICVYHCMSIQFITAQLESDTHILSYSLYTGTLVATAI